jgi:hypothetical protein
MTQVPDWVQSMTEDIIGGATLEVGKVYKHPEDGPIEVTSGQYWGKHGLSNFWYWTVIETGESHYGYGDKWPEVTS